VKFYAHKNLLTRSLDLLIIDELTHGVGAPMTLFMKVDSNDAIVREPTLSLPLEAGESLMQELWNAGFRPNTDEGTPATVNAMKKHVEFAEHVAKTLLHSAHGPK
jgi:hypothetical protein